MHLHWTPDVVIGFLDHVFIGSLVFSTSVAGGEALYTKDIKLLSTSSLQVPQANLISGLLFGRWF